MKIYNYHPLYNYFVSCTEADESPLEPGVFLIPAYATTIEPPSFESTEIPIFIENNWKIVTNYCGIYYDKVTKQPFEWFNVIDPPQYGTKKVPPKVEEGFLVLWENDDWVVTESKSGIYYDKVTKQPFQWQEHFTLPVNGTKKVPPKVEEGFLVLWENDDWVVTESKSGIYYDKVTKQPFEWFNVIDPPQYGTKKVPPKVEEGFLVLWENDDWNIVEIGIYYDIITGRKIVNENSFNQPKNSTKEKPPEVPDGYLLLWDDGWKLIEEPSPVNLTPEEKLANAGLTVDELKELLGISL